MNFSESPFGKAILFLLLICACIIGALAQLVIWLQEYAERLHPHLLFWFGMALAPVMWFGLGLLQLIVFWMDEHGFVWSADGALGILLVGTMAFALAAAYWLTRKDNGIRGKYLMLGYLVGFAVQPIIFFVHELLFP